MWENWIGAGAATSRNLPIRKTGPPVLVHGTCAAGPGSSTDRAPCRRRRQRAGDRERAGLAVQARHVAGGVQRPGAELVGGDADLEDIADRAPGAVAVEEAGDRVALPRGGDDLGHEIEIEGVGLSRGCRCRSVLGAARTIPRRAIAGDGRRRRARPTARPRQKDAIRTRDSCFMVLFRPLLPRPDAIRSRYPSRRYHSAVRPQPLVDAHLRPVSQVPLGLVDLERPVLAVPVDAAGEDRRVMPNGLQIFSQTWPAATTGQTG